MLPFNLSFRRILLRNIRKLKPDDISEFESLTALRHQFSEEKRLSNSQPDSNRSQKNNKSAINEVLNDLDLKTNNILADHKSKILKLHKIYIARKKVAFVQRNIFQFPFLKFWKYLGVLWNYKRKQLKGLF